MKMMKAVRIHSYGGSECMVYEDVPCPMPAAGEILVRVMAAGVNPVDWKIREGYLREMLQHELPLTLGWDVSGVVQAVGQGVTQFRPGDEIFSRPDLGRNGTFAEFVVIREREVALKPKSMDHVHAAAIPLAGLTAWQALYGAAKLAAGQTVLIHGAAGGVGSFAVQLAKLKGARVIATASRPNPAYLKKLGADEIIDYLSVPFDEAVSDADVVFDTIGGNTQERSWKVLKKGGILVSIVEPPSVEMAGLHGVREAFVFIRPDAEILTELAKLADDGKLKVNVDMLLPLSDAFRALEVSQEGHVRGKIVLKVG